jgi:hypothetical protein
MCNQRLDVIQRPSSARGAVRRLTRIAFLVSIFDAWEGGRRVTASSPITRFANGSARIQRESRHGPAVPGWSTWRAELAESGSSGRCVASDRLG